MYFKTCSALKGCLGEHLQKDIDSMRHISMFSRHLRLIIKCYFPLIRALDGSNELNWFVVVSRISNDNV